MMRVLRLSGLLLFTVMSACAGRLDLDPHFDAQTPGFCGISVGQPIPAGFEHRPIVVEPEGMPELRYVFEACGVEGQLRLDRDGTVERIDIITPGACLEQVCVGDRFLQVRRRHPELKVFLAREEGGMLGLGQQSGSIGYPFDTGSAPGRCFDSIDACSTEWSSAKVDSIAIAEYRAE